MKKLLKRVLLFFVVAVGVYAAMAIYLGVRDLTARLATFEAWRLAPVLGLTVVNYLLRYLKWSLYLRALDIHVPTAQNLPIFLGGLSMVVTPGKIGELLKSYLLRETRGVPMTRTVPVVVAERVTDLLALVVLMLSGFLVYRMGARALILVGGVLVAFVVIINSRRLSLAIIGLLAKLPGLARVGRRLEELYESTAILFRPGTLAAASILSIVAWFCEGLGFYLILGGFQGVAVSLLLAVFVYSATTIGGLPSPGGLVLTEGTMTFGLTLLAHVEKATAGAATLLIRLCTLWFAVVVGVIALLIFRHQAGLTEDVTEGLNRSRASEGPAAGE